jgi:adenine deaminase
MVNDLISFEVVSTFINGLIVAEKGKSYIAAIPENSINQFDAPFISAAQLKIETKDYPNQNGLIPVIEAIDGQLITNCIWMPSTEKENCLISNTTNDVLKMVVYNRYKIAAPSIAFIKNFGFTHGAIASTVAHDSHNIIAVGVDDESIMTAINSVIQEKGGVSCVNKTETKILALPVAGLMSTADPYEVAEQYTIIDAMSKGLGSKLASPFMTLSFMALLVIPHLKLSDKGLFDGDQFKLF